LTDAALPRLKTLAKRAKLIDDSSFGSRVSVDWAKLVGRHLIVEIGEREYENSKGVKSKTTSLTFAGFWHVTDSRVADVPRDSAAIKAASSNKSGGKSGGTGKSKPSAVKDEDWGEI
jgi:hypothetical protein